MSDLAVELVGRACAVTRRSESERELRALPEVRAILAADEVVRRECVLALAWSFVAELDYQHPWAPHQQHLLGVVARKQVPLTREDLARLVDAAERVSRGSVLPEWTMTALTVQFRGLYERVGDAERDEVAALIERAAALCHYKAAKNRLAGIVARAPASDAWATIDMRDDVGPRLRAALDDSGEQPDALRDLVALLRAFPSSGRPSKRWTTGAAEVQARLRNPSRLAGTLVDAILDAEDTEVEVRYGYDVYRRLRFFAGDNEALACAVVAFVGLLRDDAPAEDLGRLAAKAITGPNGWERSLRLANACVRAIGRAGSTAALRELVALERTITHGSVRREIDKAIDDIAKDRGVGRTELLETSVESHGLDERGITSVPVAGGHAAVAVEDLTARPYFVDAEGRRRRTFPAKVRTASGEAISAQRDRARAIRKTLAAERARLDGFMGMQRSWSLHDWDRLYLAHPITGHLARRLIWRFGLADREVIGLPADRGLVRTAEGATQSVDGADAVSLWHPLDPSREELLEWRSRLLTDLVVQPFRQAFRELYVITPAEEVTRRHSNRFAGHVFRQTQARALMKRRGWQPVAAAWWDDGIDHGVARRSFEDAEIRAEFYFDPIEDIEPDPSGIYRYCTSDQVRFYRGRTDDALELTEIPPVVFSEAMRDVDLFVSVTSIGADPDWHARKEGRRFEKYWDEVNFGELGAAGEIRHELLAELLPRLPIHDRCEFDDPYLVVRGNLRTYRIHLGSGLVRMSPNDTQLRIGSPPGRHAAELYLPIDDDPVLVRILALALALADDEAIGPPV